jgi:hypothetical protein
MRFLLYPRTTTISAAAARLSQSNVISANAKAKAIVAVSSSPANGVSSAVAVADTNGVTTADQTQSSGGGGTTTTRVWGQQCSPDCGCVVRLEAVIDTETRTFRRASYTAKSIVTVPTNVQDGGQRRRVLQPVLTTKGRPMMEACECKTLHHLSQAIVKHLHLPHQKVSNIQNMLEFQSTRSSLAFRRTVLRTQELSAHDTHCFDVVEEALTALVKGRIPQPRRKTGQEINKPNIKYPPNHPSRRQWQRDDDEEEDALQFGQLWRDEGYRVESSLPRVMSALTMFDLNHDHHHQESKRRGEMFVGKGGPHGPLAPADWVSYVDGIYQEEEEERSA